MRRTVLPRLVRAATTTCYLLLIVPRSTVAFTTPRFVATRLVAHQLTRHHVVFTKLSHDCLAALTVANTQALSLGAKEMDETHLLLGICEHAGTVAPILKKYHITVPKVRQTLQDLTQRPASRKPVLSLADFNSKNDKEDVMLSYGKGLQTRLFEAGKISQIMGSTQIETEHVFLSLLHYQEIDGQVYAATRGDDCEAMEILYYQDATLEGEDICQDLLQHLMTERSKPKQEEKKQSKATDASSSDRSEIRSLLAEFGSDMTLDAENGYLDVVHGRDDETESCLRILLRRRKNNCVLIGEAGVGKTGTVICCRSLSDADRPDYPIRSYTDLYFILFQCSCC
jgi:ATP-dependent Clp protease ATP-binding subunit ClpA